MPCITNELEVMQMRLARECHMPRDEFHVVRGWRVIEYLQPSAGEPKATKGKQRRKI